MNPLALYSEAHSDPRMKDGRDWMQGDQAEDEGPGRAVTGIEGELMGLEPSLEQWERQVGG